MPEDKNTSVRSASSEPEHIRSFPPIHADNPVLLILGSMPGGESLRRREYYAYKQNQFWKILFSLFEEPFSEEYADKVSLIKKRNLALWDSLGSCTRKGSLDSAIRDGRPNDLPGFFERFPSIHTVCFNGKTAHAAFVKSIAAEQPEMPVRHIVMPSTSPANTMKFEEKLRHWSQILPYL